MSTNKLFDRWTWSYPIPKPFDDIETVRTDIKSGHNTSRTAKSTLHGATLSGILAYMELEADPSVAKGAVGTQNDMVIAEYPSHRPGETHTVVFNRKSGKFIAGVFDSSGNVGNYTLTETGNTGSAMFFALIPQLLEDDEFNESYTTLLECRKDNYSDMQKAEDAAFVLCDNAYRRIAHPSASDNSGIRITIPNTGNIQPFTKLNLDSNVYSPTSVLMGSFEILKAGAAPAQVSAYIKKEDFAGKYGFSERKFTSAEAGLIPHLPDWYVIPQEVVTVCQHAKVTTASHQPMRNFMMRGPAGTGKTEGAKAIAAGLGLPYVHITCSANTEIFDLLGQMLPDMDEAKQMVEISGELPTFDDIRFDPPTAYEKLCGVYDEEITEDAVYEKLVEVIAQNIRKEQTDNAPDKESHQRFRYVDTPFVQAMRHGYVVELQEPSIIANPGVLVGLNSLLDRCAAITLPTGEKIVRHPDTVVVVTTNNRVVPEESGRSKTESE